MKNNKNIQNILEIYNNSKSDLIFNKSCQSILKKMSSPEFIHSVFEANLSDEEFINKEWKIHEIPYLNVYKNEFIDIKICAKVLSEIKNKKFIIDKNTCSYFFENIIRKNNKLLNFYDPIYFLKSIC